MKLTLSILLFCLTSIASAHQYIQCASLDPESTDRIVVNLNGDKSTLFITTGIDDPNEMRILKSIKFLKTDKDFTYYQSRDNASIETVVLPNSIIGKNAHDFDITLDIQAVEQDISLSNQLNCFSAVYPN